MRFVQNQKETDVCAMLFIIGAVIYRIRKGGGTPVIADLFHLVDAVVLDFVEQ